MTLCIQSYISEALYFDVATFSNQILVEVTQVLNLVTLDRKTQKFVISGQLMVQ